MAGKSLTVSFDEDDPRIAPRLRSGDFDTADEVVDAGLRALDREEAAQDAWMKERIEEALNDPRPPIPADEVFDRLERKQRERRARHSGAT